MLALFSFSSNSVRDSLEISLTRSLSLQRDGHFLIKGWWWHRCFLCIIMQSFPVGVNDFIFWKIWAFLGPTFYLSWFQHLHELPRKFMIKNSFDIFILCLYMTYDSFENKIFTALPSFQYKDWGTEIIRVTMMNEQPNQYSVPGWLIYHAQPLSGLPMVCQ